MALAEPDANVPIGGVIKEGSSVASNPTSPETIGLNADEIKFLLAKIAQLEFKGVEIEFAYNMIVKLQELYKKKVQ